MVLPSKNRVVVLGTGGTIAGKAALAGDNIGYTAAQVGVADLVRAVPALMDLPFELVSEQVAQVDSKDMDFSVWCALAGRVNHWLVQSDVMAVVITHGTDTLEETAWFLQSVLSSQWVSHKPVVLTCAMRPSTAITPDGPQNLVDALAVAGTPGARGVVAVCAGVVHAAQDVQKVHPYRVDAFDSGDAGPLAYVEEGCVRLLKNWPPAPTYEAFGAINYMADDYCVPWVEVVVSYAGANGLLVDALARAGVQGLVVAATGNGTLHSDLEAALLRAASAGIRVVRATRCANGRVLSTGNEHFPDSNGLSPVKARISLLLQLMLENHSTSSL